MAKGWGSGQPKLTGRQGLTDADKDRVGPRGAEWGREGVGNYSNTLTPLKPGQEGVGQALQYDGVRIKKKFSPN